MTTFLFFTVFLLEKRQIARPPAREFKWKLRISLSHPHQRKKSLSCSSRAFFLLCFLFTIRSAFCSMQCGLTNYIIAWDWIESERESESHVFLVRIQIISRWCVVDWHLHVVLRFVGRLMIHTTTELGNRANVMIIKAIRRCVLNFNQLSIKLL